MPTLQNYSLKRTYILYWLMFGLLFLYAAIALWNNIDKMTFFKNDEFFFYLATGGLVLNLFILWGLNTILSNNINLKAPLKGKVSNYTAYVVGRVIALFGAGLFMNFCILINADYYYVVLSGIVLLLFILLRPRRTHFEKKYQITS